MATERSTRLKRASLTMRLMAGLAMSAALLVIGLPFLLFFPPLTILLWFLALGAPFAFLGVVYEANCPVCLQHMDIRQKRGGLRCRKCKTLLIIEQGYLTAHQ